MFANRFHQRLKPLAMSYRSDELELPAPQAAPLVNTLVESMVLLLVATAIQRAVGFFRAMLFCRWLDAAQLGMWDMAFSFLMLVAPLSVLAVPGAFGRYVEQYRQRGELRFFLRSATLLCLAPALVVWLGLILCRQAVSQLLFGTAEQTQLVAVAACCLLGVIIYNFFVELATALRNVRLATLLQLINSLVFAGLGGALILGWQPTAESAVGAYGGSCVAAAALALGSLRRTCRAAPLSTAHQPLLQLWFKLLPFAGWLLLSSLLINLFAVIDRYLIIHFTPARLGALDLVGNYHASRVAPSLLVSVSSLAAAMLLPHLSHDWEAGKQEMIAARLLLFAKLFGLALFGATVALLLAVPLIFDIVLGGKYPLGKDVLPYTLLYCCWFCMLLVVQNYLLCAERAPLVSVALFGGLVVNVPLNVLLLPHLGLHGVVLAATAANAFSLMSVCFFNRRLGFALDRGARLVLLLPLTLCAGPWAAAGALTIAVLDLLWGRQLFSRNEKERLFSALSGQLCRCGLCRYWPMLHRN